jgi:hypothetical protein
MKSKQSRYKSSTLAAMQAVALAANAAARPENRRPITLRDLSKPAPERSEATSKSDGEQS